MVEYKRQVCIAAGSTGKLRELFKEKNGEISHDFNQLKDGIKMIKITYISIVELYDLHQYDLKLYCSR
jgi:hypothetical protein